MTQATVQIVPQAGDTLLDDTGRRRFDIFTRTRAIALDQARGSRPLVPVAPDADDDDLLFSWVSALAGTVLARRLLIVHGEQDTPLAGLVRRVAAEVAQGAANAAQNAAQNAAMLASLLTGQAPLNPPEPLPTLALLDAGCGLRHLKQILRDERSPVVIIAEGANRRLAGWDLNKLQADVKRHGHYLILATTAPQLDWQIHRTERVYWRDSQVSARFDPSRLAKLALTELLSAQPPLDQSVLAWARRDLGAIVDSLGSPLHINVFARAIRDERPSSEAAAQSILNEVAGRPMSAVVNRWFHSQLDQRTRLLACGLCFFDGLWEETAFFYLGRLLEQVWGYDTAGTLDHISLAGLETLFAFTRSRPPQLAIRGRYAGQRRLIFAEALPQLRRHARQALYAGAELLRSLLSPGDVGPGAHGSDRSELRRALAVGFADLGPIDRRLLDDPLLLLVADGRPPLRELVGAVLGRWYAAPNDRDLFFETVRLWRDRPESVAFVEALFASGQVAGPADPADCIDAVLLTACSYAASADRPGAISTRLRDLIVALSANPGERTQRALQEVAIAQIVDSQIVPALLRPQQQADFWLDDWLRDLTRFDSLRRAVAAELAAAAEEDHDADVQIAGLIARWHAAADKAGPYQPDGPLTTLDTALIAVTEVLSRLGRAVSPAHTQARDMVDVLAGLRAQPRHPELRRALDGALLRAGARDNRYWSTLLADAGPDELARSMELLRVVHLEERAILKPGNAQLSLYGRSYAVSLSTPPPLTTSKQFVDYALGPNQTRGAYRLALCADLAMAQDFDLHEQALIDQLPGAGEGPIAPPPPPAQPNSPARPAFFRDRFLPIFVSQGAPDLREPIAALLPIAAALPPGDPALTYLLERSWPGGSRPALAPLAAPLREAVELAQLGPVGVAPGDYPRAARALRQVLEEEGVLREAIIAAVLLGALILFGLLALITVLV